MGKGWRCGGISGITCLSAGMVLSCLLVMGCGGGGGSVQASPASPAISIFPQSVSLLAGQTTQFTASVTGTSNSSVAWSVNDVPGGNPTVGLISLTGLYTAPAVPPSPNTVTVKATAAADSALTKSAQVSISNPAPAVVSVSPSAVNAGSPDTPLSVTGTGFAQQSVVRLGSVALATTFASPTQLTAVVPSAQLSAGGSFPITVVTPSPGGGTSVPVTFTVNQPPSITSAGSTTFVVNTVGSFTVTATGFPAPTLSEMGTLPSGVTFNASTEALSGTAAAGSGGSYPITLTASNGITPNATQNFTLTVNQPPSITSADSTTFVANTAGSFTVTAAGFPTPTLSESGALPSGVTFDATTGVLSGTSTTAASFPLTITAGNGISPNATQSFTLTVGQSPTITSASRTTFTVGAAGSFTVTATGFPTPTLSESGALPSGVTFNAGTGILSGTPTTGTGGTYNITFTASNGVGTSATQSFTVTVDQAPAITSASSTTFTVGAAGSFTVTATGFPAPTFSETGTLPSGVTLSAGGVLSGTPASGTGGSYNIALTASNGVGTSATQSFTLTVNQAPAITSANSATFTVGAAGSFTVTATGFPTPTLSESGVLPSGVTFNAVTGVLSGTPATGTSGTYNITFVASNGVSTNAGQNFTLTVNPPPSITFTSAASATFTVGVVGTFTVTATSSPTPTLSESGALPSGVTFNASTGILSGTPAAGTGGAYNITFTASNGVSPNATQSFTLTVGQSPAITSASRTTFTVGAAGSFTLTATGFPTPTLSESGALPSGVTFNAGTGILSGTPTTGTGGTYSITFTASNGVGTSATQSFTLSVDNLAPVLASILPTAVNAGAPDTTLTLTGSSFTAQSVAQANSTTLATVFVSSTQLTATIPAAMMVNTGTLAISASSPPPGGGTSTSVSFTVYPSYPRSNATGVLRNSPPLTVIPVGGTVESVLDWTSKDSDGTQEDVVATDHSLAPMGIPNIDTTSLATATANSFVTVAGALNTSSSLSSSEISSLMTYVQNGGTLYLWRPTVTALLTSLGITGYNSYSGTTSRPLTFDTTQSDPLLKYIDNPVEVNWQVELPSYSTSLGYLPGSCTVLATWSTGDAAVLDCALGKGHGYVFGWRLRHILALAERQIVSGTAPRTPTFRYSAPTFAVFSCAVPTKAWPRARRSASSLLGAITPRSSSLTTWTPRRRIPLSLSLLTWSPVWVSSPHSTLPRTPMTTDGSALSTWRRECRTFSTR